MRYVVHYTGDWVRNDANTAATREAPTVAEYDALDAIPKGDRWAFDWMLEHGEIVVTCGAYVYQIRQGDNQ